MASRRCLIVALGVMLLAGGLRFAKLGAWSFAIDEIATNQEADELLEGRPLTANPLSRLPRMIPLGHLLHGPSYRYLGQNEFAGRLPAAVLGTLLCGLIVAGLWKPLGSWPAAATGLLVAVNPEYIFQSQNNRFYMTAATFATAAVLAAAVALQRRSVAWMVVAAGCVTVGMFAHTMLAGLIAGLGLTALMAPTGETRNRGRMVLVVIAAAVVIAVVGLVYVVPLARGWNSNVGWGYSSAKALLGGVNSLGIPTTLLAGLGVLLFLANRDPWRWFWAVWAAAWLASVLVLPRLVTYHPAYGFLFQFGPMVLAGYAVGTIAQNLSATSGRLAGAAWVAIALLMNAPALASHYLDGSRPNQRGAAAYVAAELKPGDAVYAVSPGNLAKYQPEKLGEAEALSPDRLRAELEAMAAQGKPAWLVLPAGRAGREADVQDWLNANTRLKRTFKKTRFDYYDFTLDVYKFEPK